MIDTEMSFEGNISLLTIKGRDLSGGDQSFERNAE